jgi:hypothetical protein
VGQTIASLGYRDPRLQVAGSGKLDIRLHRQLQAYSKTDPPPARFKPIPLQIIQHVVQQCYTTTDARHQTIGLVSSSYCSQVNMHTLTTRTQPRSVYKTFTSYATDCGSTFSPAPNTTSTLLPMSHLNSLRKRMVSGVNSSASATPGTSSSAPSLPPLPGSNTCDSTAHTLQHTSTSTLMADVGPPSALVN